MTRPQKDKTVEIERKFLVASDSWKSGIVKSEEIIQYYLTGLDQVPTVRLRQKGNTGFLTIKYPSRSADIIDRQEFEYEIPVEDVRSQQKQAKGHIIHKVRHTVKGPDGFIWEVDEFKSPNPLLTLAEIELSHVDEKFLKPDWAGEDVTSLPAYSNIRMAFDNDPSINRSADI
ncbi:CYTH domain-containing protein [Sneathiella sp.]|jgi:adenylate cyclase|uniref:CYTH domain-containing protein n=1 Tax=Sneathiella sp. TaxID=1964365 RepID=UPI0039E4E2FB